MVYFSQENLLVRQYNGKPKIIPWEYQDFHNGFVSVSGSKEPITVDLVQIKTNDRKSWQTATSTNTNCMCRIYEVDLTKTEVTDTHIENLQYFLIRADRVKNAGKNSPQLGLMIYGREDDIFRIRTFFSLIAGPDARYNFLYRVWVPASEQDSKSDTGSDPSADLSQYIWPFTFSHDQSKVIPGRIMPLMHIVHPDATRFAGDVSLDDLFSTTEYDGTSSGQKLADSELRDCVEQELKIANIPWWNSVRELCRLYWNRIIQGVKGNTTFPMNVETKRLKCEQITDFVIEKREHLSMLGELCWFYNLYAQMEDKELLQVVDKSWELNYPVLLQSYLDAINYSDGIAQILENSCQHTSQRASYFNMRLRRVKRDTTDLQLIANMRNRELLMNRYKDLSGLAWQLDKQAKYYVDISIVDDARSGKELHGLLKIYRDNVRKRYNLSEKDLPKTLEDVFRDDRYLIASPASIVHHYGLDALKQVIAKNQGTFLVSSPYTEEDPNVQTTEVVRYPIPEKEKERPPLRKGVDETTEYHILYPLGLSVFQQTPNDKPQQESAHNLLFEVDDLTNWEIVTKKLQLPESIFDIQSQFVDQEEKIGIVNKAVERFWLDLKHEFGDDEDYLERAFQNNVYLYDIRSSSSLQLELFAKFLFHLINGEKRNGIRQLFAVYFDDSLRQQEFIRLFAIFYKRACQPENCHKFLGAQIALCSTHPTLNIPEVNLVLNAKNWNSLMESARRFAYCNLESAQRVYSQIRYFAGMNSKNDDGKNDTSQFPFDLFLNDDMGLLVDKPRDSVDIAETSNCWFLRRISNYMEMDYQKNGFGIKVSDAHFYLHSNVHLDAFYHAEQLFHNIAYVWRFAYLLARRLLGSGYHCKNYFLVCYEAYSTLLVQYLKDYLKKGHPETETVEYAIMYQSEDGKPRLLMPEQLEKKDWGFVCLYPIGTTLSTLHTMHDCINEEFKVSLSSQNMRDMVLVLVAADQNSESLQLRYWHHGYLHDEHSSPQQKAQVLLYNRYDDTEWPVGYFIVAHTRWHDPLHCAETDRGRPLVHADMTSTQLNMIFPPKIEGDSLDNTLTKENWKQIHEHDVCSLLPFEKIKENDRRLELMRNCIHYGHIVEGHNHFAFYVDIARYFRALKITGDNQYQNWLDEMRENAFAPDAFNIVVTPLRTGRSSLLKDLVDNVFSRCTHILQLDLHNVRRTDVRTRYRFIGTECAQLLRNDPTADINVYYVDDSIVTAETLQRGLTLIQMILRDCIPPEKEIQLYKGVFVLINRSSKDTIQSYVKDPLRDYHAFVHLAIPHYNTRNGVCPSCKHVEKYKMLASHSATNAFVEEFHRVSDKNKKRTAYEFGEWQKDRLRKSTGAFLRLKQWVYHSNRNDEDVKSVRSYLQKLQDRFYERFCRDLEIQYYQRNQNDVTIKPGELHDYLSGGKILTGFEKDEIRQQFLISLEQTCLSDLAFSEDWEDTAHVSALERIWADCVIGERTYRRMMSTHNAYSKILLEKELMAPDLTHTAAIDQMKQMIMEYLEREIKTVPNKKSPEKSPVNIWEQIHSSLKVVSRDNLTRHHLVQEAIFDLLHEAADLMLNIHQTNSRLRKLFCVEKTSVGVPCLCNKKCMSIDPLLRYQMFYSIIRRLADMQSNYLIMRLADNTIPQQFDSLTEDFFASASEQKIEQLNQLFCCPIPSRNRMLFTYEKCVKLSTMANDEKNKSMLIQIRWKHTP